MAFEFQFVQGVDIFPSPAKNKDVLVSTRVTTTGFVWGVEYSDASWELCRPFDSSATLVSVVPGDEDQDHEFMPDVPGRYLVRISALDTATGEAVTTSIVYEVESGYLFGMSLPAPTETDEMGDGERVGTAYTEQQLLRFMEESAGFMRKTVTVLNVTFDPIPANSVVWLVALTAWGGPAGSPMAPYQYVVVALPPPLTGSDMYTCMLGFVSEEIAAGERGYAVVDGLVLLDNAFGTADLFIDSTGSLALDTSIAAGSVEFRRWAGQGYYTGIAGATPGVVRFCGIARFPASGTILHAATFGLLEIAAATTASEPYWLEGLHPGTVIYATNPTGSFAYVAEIPTPEYFRMSWSASDLRVFMTWYLGAHTVDSSADLVITISSDPTFVSNSASYTLDNYEYEGIAPVFITWADLFASNPTFDPRLGLGILYAKAEFTCGVAGEFYIGRIELPWDTGVEVPT